MQEYNNSERIDYCEETLLSHSLTHPPAFSLTPHPNSLLLNKKTATRKSTYLPYDVVNAE